MVTARRRPHSSQDVAGGQLFEEAMERPDADRAVFEFRRAGIDAVGAGQNLVGDQGLERRAVFAAPDGGRLDFDADGAVATGPDEVHFGAVGCAPVVETASRLAVNLLADYTKRLPC